MNNNHSEDKSKDKSIINLKHNDIKTSDKIYLFIFKYYLSSKYKNPN